MKNNLSEDSLAILLLCSNLATYGKTGSFFKPFTLKEWDSLSHKIIESVMKRPGAFFYTTPEEWRECLNLTPENIQRIQNLLTEGGQLGIELERLSSLGIWVTTRAEASYPARLKKVLRQKSPVVLFGAGDASLFQSEGVAIVGSRNVDEIGSYFAEKLAGRCVTEGLTVVSGGARGVDMIAQNSALRSGGKVISVLSNSMETSIRQRENREAIVAGRLLLLSSTHPKAPFNVYNAMDRNKYIYALSHYAVVVSSEENKGGTWTGATENLKAGWVPLFVRVGGQVPAGNNRLLEKGAIAFDSEVLADEAVILRNWLSDNIQVIVNYESSKRNENNISSPKKDHQLAFRFDDSTVSHQILDNPEQLFAGNDLFTVVWPYIEKVLEKSQKTEKELAEMFNVRSVQIQDWLKRAVDEQKVKRLIKPVRYVVASYGPSGQERLPVGNIEQAVVFESCE
ncbi:conserved hypothetical protein [Desulfofarcimen acetoxidans DSM 771]|uniref:Smf/DprA SLOG domain-containing protein n=1 Tax=Desulfofarcimen acetoxidans (strain ATCC 49208 / DSM 771 / KCTC 5769 / VKM B-1644 / 5575) TaxID=485916 RepID=C8W6B2_DESAS|nr:DNA-processing protein DprA [Desulfofarcimen acetoxidans]ACV62201.1 conserved hypothetical protein [Desulfofarcimen acetoxidans DSM 771]